MCDLCVCVDLRVDLRSYHRQVNNSLGAIVISKDTSKISLAHRQTQKCEDISASIKHATKSLVLEDRSKNVATFFPFIYECKFLNR